MIKKLKPCPFCGGKATITSFCDDIGEYYVVCCETEGCRGNLDYAWSDTLNIAEAIEAWNRRVTE